MRYNRFTNTQLLRKILGHWAYGVWLSIDPKSSERIVLSSLALVAEVLCAAQLSLHTCKKWHLAPFLHSALEL